MLRFHHVNLGVANGGQDAEEQFLTEVLGYRRLTLRPELEGLVRWFEADDGSQVHLSEDPDHRPAARAHVAIDLADTLAAMESTLDAAGISYDAIEDDGVRLVFCQDPAGNRWELRGRARAA
jgi:catechol 2,3-dioxygenase-like lactoylglutathione lyase family enzyme